MAGNTYYMDCTYASDASLTQVGERRMSNAAEREGRLCLFVAHSALSLTLQALHGTPQTEIPLRRKTVSAVVSTFPLRLGLNKLASVAKGVAKSELLTALNVNDTKKLNKFYPELDTKLSCLTESDMIMLNKFYVNYTDELDPRFIADSYKNFGVHTDKMRFQNPVSVVDFINQWVDSTTYKRIPNLMSPKDINPSDNLILINAVYMKVLMLRLFCDGCKMTFFLPNEVSGLPKLLQLFDKKPEVPTNAVKKLELDIINVRIPVLKIKTMVNWTPFLKLIGVKKIFDTNSSGLDAISQGHPKTNHHLGNVIQKVFIELDEFGIYREAPLSPVDLPVNTITRAVPQFIADHPFYFKIEMEDDGVSHELISGVFYGNDKI
ncbi:alaserpin-like [Amyelois transitella]|uniref:alaserpin-like n=1 Tax=Amyelois transitella TaxID=680683 RepID=UPI00298F848E|nr:alaserpin-like [Amyelois transitella]